MRLAPRWWARPCGYLMSDALTKKPPRTFKIGIRVTAAEIERIRIAAAKQGLRAGTWVQRVAVDAALRAA